jgi:hypothetical protein
MIKKKQTSHSIANKFQASSCQDHIESSVCKTQNDLWRVQRENSESRQDQEGTLVAS